MKAHVAYFFKHYPSDNVVHETADEQLFPNVNEARAHASHLEDREVKTHVRPGSESAETGEPEEGELTEGEASANEAAEETPAAEAEAPEPDAKPVKKAKAAKGKATA